MNSKKITKGIADISQRTAALVAGIGSLIMFFAAIVAEFLARQGLVVPGNAAETAQKIMTHETLFRAGIFSYLIILILDVVLAWAFYVFLIKVNKSLSLLTAWFRLVYTAVFGAALLNLVSILRLISGADFLTVSGTDQLHDQMMLSLTAFGDGWAIGYMFFSLHVFFLGYLIFRSGYVPRILGILLIIASVGYLSDNLANLLLPDYLNYKTIFMVIVMVPAIAGEMGLAVWLLLKGGKVPSK
ncbi:MAG: hypothetical protein AMS26_13155 [Bacteroides sp. SM23_62]|nr:MAG: hypothetical protein AMS26_13155 [Bacteroides sp. SM23_62]